MKWNFLVFLVIGLFPWSSIGAEPLKPARFPLDCPHDIPIRIIDQAAKTHFKAIKDLNPEIREYHLPEGRHEILIPGGTSEGFHARYQDLLMRWLVDRKERIYVVKGGTTFPPSPSDPCPRVGNHLLESHRPKRAHSPRG